jgi:peptide/nickel transport system ATP-binding protein
MDICRVETPTHFVVGDAPGHWAACWLFDVTVPKQPAAVAPAVQG